MSRARDIADRVLHNRTHEDTDGGRESTIVFKGEQSGGELSTLAEIQASHDGSSDDEKGDLIFKTNDGSDGASPTEAMRITSDQRLGIGLTAPTAPLTVKSPTNAEAIHVVGRSDDIGQMKFFEADHTTILSTLEARNSFVNFGSVPNIPLQFMTNNTERMNIDGSGTIFCGTSLSFGGKINVHEGGIGVGESASSGYYRRIYWNAANNEMRFWNGTNEARITDSGVFTNASDISLKKDIADIEYGIDTVKSLQPRKYKMKSDDKEQVGFIAQEMESHVPEIVSVGVTPDGDEHKGISYGQLTAVLTKALQEAIAKIETLETKVAALEAE